MRKLIFILLALLTLTSPCLAQEQTARMSLSVVGASTAAAAASCDPATNEVGDRGSYASSGAIVLDESYAILAVADCSGTLGYGTITVGTGGASAKICVYNDTGDGVPNDAGDTLIGCSNAISTAAGAGTYTSSSKVTGSVTSGNSYWLVILSGGSTLSPKYGSGSQTIYYGSSGAGSYATPPANLGAWSLSAAASSALSAFVTIE